MDFSFRRPLKGKIYFIEELLPYVSMTTTPKADGKIGVVEDGVVLRPYSMNVRKGRRGT